VTDPAHPREIAFFDRGPMDSTKLLGAGSWSAYWYNGYIVSSEIARGLDIFALPAQRVHVAERARRREADPLRLPECPGSAAAGVARELRGGAGVSGPAGARERPGARQGGRGPKGARGAEQASGQGRRDALTQLAAQLKGDAQGAADQAKLGMLAGTVTDLAGAAR